MDYNRDVRRATHDTMTNLVMAAGYLLLSPFLVDVKLLDCRVMMGFTT